MTPSLHVVHESRPTEGVGGGGGVGGAYFMKLRDFEEKIVSYHWRERLRFRRHALQK